MSQSTYKVTQERKVIVSANSSGEAAQKAIKLFDKKDCTIHETVKKEN
jgi:uncharacterized OsmC-like protein